ncbi:hypothetical protein M0804_011287 [Polistes exclamans]|nr:hypothetical protein M0804_011287 [Polistes exclamans]
MYQTLFCKKSNTRYSIHQNATAATATAAAGAADRINRKEASLHRVFLVHALTAKTRIFSKVATFWSTSENRM